MHAWQRKRIASMDERRTQEMYRCYRPVPPQTLREVVVGSAGPFDSATPRGDPSSGEQQTVGSASNACY
jgi:hypothetical protein